MWAQIQERIRVLNAHSSYGLTLLRMYLGVALVVRGGLWVLDPTPLTAMLGSGDMFLPMALAHYLIAAHLFGGAMLAAGFMTRSAALLQVPILLGAVFMIHWEEGLLAANQSLELSGLVLVMLMTFAVFGPGPVSVDAWLAAESDEPQRAYVSGRAVAPPPRAQHAH